MEDTSSKQVRFSESDCRHILVKKLNTEDFKYSHHHLIPFGKVNGFLGDHSSLTISIERNGTEESHTFFVKSVPTVRSQRNFALEINGFFKEYGFFTKYLSLLKKYSINILDDVIPTCFYTNGENFVFEDLTLAGYKTMSPRVPLSIDCVKAALSSLAKLHASGIILEETKSFRLIEEFVEELDEAFHSGKKTAEGAMKAYRHGFEALLDLTHDDEMKISKDLFKEKIFEGCHLQKKFVEPSTKYRNTICHGDLWTKNLMFRVENEVKCVIVDFQSCRYTPPGQDVMAFLFLTTDRSFRAKHLTEMLQFYYKELDTNLEKFGFGGVVSNEEFFDSCDHYKQFVLTQNCTHFQVVVMSEDVASELLADEDEAYLVLFDNKYDFMMTSCQKDPVFKKINFEALAELREFYENQL